MSENVDCLSENFKPYSYISEIGKGSYGRVCKVSKDNKEYVVKVQTLDQNSIFEVLLLQSMNHPNILRPVEITVSPEKNRVHIFQKLYSTNPKSWKFGMPTTAQITSVALKLASALAYLHERGVIHGDLKPQNIVFDGDEPILIDFGLSQFLPGYVRSPILAGSLPFIIQTETFRAPELEARTRRILYDFKIDTFSLGGTLYKFLTSQYPVPSIARASDSYKNYYVDSYSEVRKNLLDLTVDYRDLLVPLLQHQSSQRQACRRFLQDRNITVETFTFQLPEDLTLPSQFRRKMYERIKNRVRISGLVKDCPNSEIYAWSLQILLQMEMLLEVFQNRTLKNNIPGSKKDSLTEDVITMITDFAIFFVTGYDDEIANYDNTFQKFIAEYLFAGGKLQFLPRDIDCLKMLKKYIR